jgi:hypothetical protein
MLSSDAAEGEDSSERGKGQSSLSQPSGTTLSQPSGTTLIQPSGTTLSQPSDTPLSQPSGTQSPLTQPSGKQSPSCLLEGVMASPAPTSAPMPFFTGHHQGAVRLLPPRKGKAISVVTMSSKGETSQLAQTTTSQIDGRIRPQIVKNTAKHQARINDIVERQRNGTCHMGGICQWTVMTINACKGMLMLMRQ